MDADDRLRVRVVVEGKVQGVWFRAWTQEQAVSRSLLGWVRNRRDGSVEAVFDGVSAEVEAMIQACWTGPPAARVLAVRVEPIPTTPEFEVFTILPSA
ncbi:MAG: acylphosphatase [Rhodospirillaceae bacterium]|nr:acylphosphatase [Rhodospirillaceae bacterium]